MFKKTFFTFIFVLTAPFIYWSIIITAIDIIANISNKNIHPANNFNAATLALETSPSSDFKTLLIPEKTAKRSIIITANQNKIKPQYSIVAADFKGKLCSHLQLTAVLNNQQKFHGPLVDFAQTLLLGSEAHNWIFKIKLTDQNPNWQNQDCYFVFNFYADENNEPQQVKNHIQSGEWEKIYNQANYGDIIINEIMLPTAKKPNSDCWLELKNKTNHDFDISRWILANVLSNKKHLRFPQKTIIPANGYFLLARRHSAEPNCLRAIKADLIVGSLNLATSSSLVLKDSADHIIDRIKLPRTSKPLYSWQRNYPATSTIVFMPWHLCQNQLAQSQIFWKQNNLACGTPKAKNLFNISLKTKTIEKPLFYLNEPALDKKQNKENNQKIIKPIKILTASSAPPSSLKADLSQINVIPVK